MAEGVWLSIIEYANLKDISISTIRRHIKSKRVKSKNENGKYFIFVPENKYKQVAKMNTANTLEEENAKLKRELKQKQDELDDLNTLIKLYEQGFHAQNKPTAKDFKKELR